MIKPINTSIIDLKLPISNEDVSIYHIQTAFNNNTKPCKQLNTFSDIFYALPFIEYTDHKNYIKETVLTSYRMTLLNKLQYKFL